MAPILIAIFMSSRNLIKTDTSFDMIARIAICAWKIFLFLGSKSTREALANLQIYNST